MANDEIIKRIDAAVSRLCTSLDAIYTNLFDRNHVESKGTSHLINPRRVIPIGTYACGLWESGENIHLVCVSNNIAETFWNFFKERLCLDEDAKLPRNHEQATIELSAARLSRKTDVSKCCLHEFSELSILDNADCKFYLHYAEGEKAIIDRAFIYPSQLIPFPSINLQTRPSLCNIIIARDIEIVARTTAGLNYEFTALIRDLRNWAHSQGLVGAKFGFLDSNDFVWLAHGTLMDNDSDESAESDAIVNLQAAFDRLFAHIRIQPSSTSNQVPQLKCRTTGEERIVRSLSVEAKEAICKADPRSKSTDAWKLKRPASAAEDRFLKVEADCWAPRLDARTDFQEKVVPRNINKLIEEIDHPILSLRIWPTPIVHTSDQTKQVYAIGINFTQPFEIDPNDIADHSLDYDRTIGLIQVAEMSRDGLESLTEGVAEFETPIDESAESDDADAPGAVTILSASPKFRPAHSAISRLKYDPKHMCEKYEVGYEDRFVEKLMWLSLEEWGGKAVEDENFIPEHRVRQLRRSKDKGVVWDRANRVDLT